MLPDQNLRIIEVRLNESNRGRRLISIGQNIKILERGVDEKFIKIWVNRVNRDYNNKKYISTFKCSPL